MADFSTAFSDLVPAANAPSPSPDAAAAPANDFGSAFADLVPHQPSIVENLERANKNLATPIVEGGPRGGLAGALNNRVVGNVLGALIDKLKAIPDFANKTLEDAKVAPGLRREDFTDVPGNSQPVDPLVADATNIAGTVMSPSAGRLVGTNAAGVLGEGGGRITAKPDSIMPDRAARLIAKRFAEDGIAPADVARAALEQARLGASGTMPLDLGGDSVRRLVGSTYRTGKEAGQTIATRLSENAADQGARLGRTITETLADPNIAYRTADDISRARGEAAAPLYQQAYEAGDRPVWSPALERLSSSPTVQSAMQGAVRIWRDSAIADGYGAMNPGALVENGGQLKFLNGKVPVLPNLQFWDYTKRIIDDQIGAAVRAGENQKARTLTTLARALRSELDAQVPAYAEARAAYAGPSQNMDAIEAGMAAINKPHEVVASEIAELPAQAQEMYRLGFARAVQRAKFNTEGDVTRGLLKPEFNRTMQAVYPDAASFRRAQNHILAEQQQMRNRNSVTGGSQTAQRGADDAAAGVTGAIGHVTDFAGGAAKGGALGVVKTAASKGLDWYINNKLGLNDPKLAAEVADMMTARISDPQKFGQVMKRVQDEYKRIKK